MRLELELSAQAAKHRFHFELAYCVRLNNIYNRFFSFLLHKEDKYTVLWHTQALLLLYTNVRLFVFAFYDRNNIHFFQYYKKVHASIMCHYYCA